MEKVLVESRRGGTAFARCCGFFAILGVEMVTSRIVVAIVTEVEMSFFSVDFEHQDLESETFVAVRMDMLLLQFAQPVGTLKIASPSHGHW